MNKSEESTAIKYIRQTELDLGEDDALTVTELRNAIKRSTRQPRGAAPQLPTDTQYGVIYADPPWSYNDMLGDARSIENHYYTMTTEDICSLPVEQCAEDDCVLFLWATSPNLPAAMQVMSAWGFEYKTSMVWIKSGLGLGRYVRVNHELLLIGTRGKPGTPAHGDRPHSDVNAKKGRHSQKPNVFYGIIERMYPGKRRLELFSRNHRANWDAWGNEVSGADYDKDP